MNHILKCTYKNKVFVFNRNTLAIQNFLPQNLISFWGLSDKLCLEKMNIELIISMSGNNKNFSDQKVLNEIKKQYISEIVNDGEQIQILNAISKEYTYKLKNAKDHYVEQVKKIIGSMNRGSIIKTIYESRKYPILKSRAENYKEFLKTGNIIYLLFSIHPSHMHSADSYLSELGLKLCELLKNRKYLYKYKRHQYSSRLPICCF